MTSKTTNKFSPGVRERAVRLVRGKCPLDHVNRQFKAERPNALWLCDFTYMATWAGFVYVAFVSNAYARRIVGGVRHERPMRASCSPPWSRLCMTGGPAIVAGSCITVNRGSQYISIKYTERGAQAGIEPSVGSVGDSYDCKYAAAARGV